MCTDDSALLPFCGCVHNFRQLNIVSQGCGQFTLLVKYYLQYINLTCRDLLYMYKKTDHMDFSPSGLCLICSFNSVIHCVLCCQHFSLDVCCQSCPIEGNKKPMLCSNIFPHITLYGDNIVQRQIGTKCTKATVHSFKLQQL